MSKKIRCWKKLTDMQEQVLDEVFEFYESERGVKLSGTKDTGKSKKYIDPEYIKVSELKELIKDLDEDAVVIMTQDAEGNEYSPLTREMFVGNYAPYTHIKYNGEVGLSELTDDLIKEGYDDEDVIDGIPCVVLYPMN